jgi:phenylacetate-CoA ligase
MIGNAWKTVAGIYAALEAGRWPAEKIAQHQTRALQELLAFAYENVPFYRSHFDAARFHPRAFRSLADLAAVPFLEKQHLKETPPELLVARGVDVARCQSVATSGSTGSPLRILLDTEGQRAQRISAWRIQFEHGFRWHWRAAEIRMATGATHPAQRLGIAPKTWISILEPPERWVETIRAARPEVILAAASTLEALAEAWSGDMPRPRIVIADCETLYPATRRLVRERMGVEPVNIYGLVELSEFAWECEQHDGYHVNADSHVVETVDGEIVATDLRQRTMPVIRYRTGDQGEWAAGRCGCGRTLPRLGRIDGREADAVRLPSGRRLFWPFFHEILGEERGLRRWRAVQEGDGGVRLELETGQEEAERLAWKVRAALPEALGVRGVAVERVETRPGVKFRAVVREGR